MQFAQNINPFSTDDNQKCFSSVKLSYYNNFSDTEDCSNDAENTALITGINYIFKIYD